MFVGYGQFLSYSVCYISIYVLLDFEQVLSTWSYFKLQSHTGYGNGRATVVGAAVVFVAVFVVVFTLFHLFLH